MGSSDGRGSKPQQFLFDIVRKIYPNMDVVYEQQIVELNQRFDIFVKELGIAIEYDGIQHDKYVEHFHKDINGYIGSIQRDKKKNEYAQANGIKVIRLNGDIYYLDEIKLKTIIDSIEYPNTEYNMNLFSKVIRKDLLLAKEARRKSYLKNKQKQNK